MIVVCIFMAEVLSHIMLTSEAILIVIVRKVFVISHRMIFIMVSPVGLMLVMPVIWTMFNAMSIVVLVNMLRMVLTVVDIRVIVAKMLITLRLNIVVLTVLFACEVSFVTKMRDMILQIPVALFKVSIGVMFKAMG